MFMDYSDLIFYRLELKLKIESNVDSKRSKARNFKKKKTTKTILTCDHQQNFKRNETKNKVNILKV